ncbi:MAG: TrbI/VirB10 family protein [Spirochaetaceae bacterium]|jgi:type IV secretion system protein VirB10|nr:TrbI/VirB10 family protein [Spirochaetaceae bacterium]
MAAYDEKKPDPPEPAPETPGEESYETTPDAATSFGPPSPALPFFDRGKVLRIVSVVFVILVAGGFIFSLSRTRKRNTAGSSAAPASRAPADFLRSQRDRALSLQAAGEDPGAGLPEASSLPAVYRDETPQSLPRPYAQTAPPPPAAPPPGRAAGPAVPTAYFSPLVPGTIEGSLFGGRNTAGQAAPGSYAEQYPYAVSQGQNAAAGYLAQARGQAGAAEPYPSAPGPQDSLRGEETVPGGRYTGDLSLWPGTVIPAVLETAINTDLPGGVIARVTRNVYDSRTGRNLLIPQGSVLVARYNSSVSYAQHRVQIVWDTLIRPDGLQADLGGMNGVDRRGMAGQEAEYHENWFEYLKAAGIITMFSIANAKMTEEAAKYASDTTASAIAQANSEFVNEAGGNIVSRAMGVQPTLTVENGTQVNVMLSRTVSLPPVPDYPVRQRYIRRQP